jgi:PAS domain S-box-containing protein
MTKPPRSGSQPDKPGRKPRAKPTAPRFGALLDALPDATIVFGPSHELMGTNQRFADLFGLSATEAKDLDWPTYRRVVLSSLREEARPRAEAALENSATDFDLEVQNPRERLLRVRRTPIEDDEGRMVGQLIVYRDVTEQTSELDSTNRELRDTQAALLHSEKMASLGNLLAGVAHEINTPIGSINSNSDVALRALEKLREALNKASPEVREDPALKNAVEILQSIGQINKTACDRIVKIVRSLRNFARLEEAEPKAANLHEGLESTLTLVHHEIKNRIEVTRDYGEIPDVVCLPDQLNQVFMNILVNAAHAIEGNGKIAIRTRFDGGNVIISFADTGKGISAENLPRIFDPGFTTKGVGVGSGLGLPICYKIVKEHGGRIDVQSELGKGTTVTVTLPSKVPERGQPGES